MHICNVVSLHSLSMTVHELHEITNLTSSDRWRPDHICHWCWLWTPRSDHVLFQTSRLSDWKNRLQCWCQEGRWKVRSSKNIKKQPGGSNVKLCNTQSRYAMMMHKIDDCIYRCNKKNSCTIRASNAVFGDPCGGIYKYLEVAYLCECE